MSRTLRLKKDTLTELTSDELAALVGGITYKTDSIVCPSLPLWSCISCDRAGA